MLKILSILAMMSSSVNGASVMLNNNTTKNIINKADINNQDLIDLSTIKLKKIELNLYDVSQKSPDSFNQDEVFKTIMTEEIKQNKEEAKKLVLIFQDWLKNKDDWMFTEFPVNYPDGEEKVTEEVGILYTGQGNFTGLLGFTVILKNAKEIELDDLDKIFIKKDLGNISDSELVDKENILNKILANNNEQTVVTSDDIQIKEINYKNITIIPKDGSRFKGLCTFAYKIKFENLADLTPNDVSTEAYSSTKRNYTNATVEITPKLGKQVFINSLSKIDYTLVATLDDNEWDHDIITIDSKNSDSQLGHTEIRPRSIDLKQESGEYQLAYRHYSNVNWMETSITISWGWNGDSLFIKLVNYAGSYASGWNAYWAKAYVSGVKLSGYTFS